MEEWLLVQKQPVKHPPPPMVVRLFILQHINSTYTPVQYSVPIFLQAPFLWLYYDHGILLQSSLLWYERRPGVFMTAFMYERAPTSKRLKNDTFLLFVV